VVQKPQWRGWCLGRGLSGRVFVHAELGSSGARVFAPQGTLRIQPGHGPRRLHPRVHDGPLQRHEARGLVLRRKAREADRGVEYKCAYARARNFEISLKFRNFCEIFAKFRPFSSEITKEISTLSRRNKGQPQGRADRWGRQRGHVIGVVAVGTAAAVATAAVVAIADEQTETNDGHDGRDASGLDLRAPPRGTKTPSPKPVAAKWRTSRTTRCQRPAAGPPRRRAPRSPPRHNFLREWRTSRSNSFILAKRRKIPQPTAK